MESSSKGPVTGTAEVHVLAEGYSRLEEDCMKANCSCVLIRDGGTNIIVDTMTAWDKDTILQGLSKHGLSPEDVTFAIGTHGHSDHVGNLNLFTNATHIVGFTVSYKDSFFYHPFDNEEDYEVTACVRVVPTPGHTADHVSVLAKTAQGTVAIAGDLFEKEEDIADPTVWQDAGSDNQGLQIRNRQLIAQQVEYIIPGHGPKFKVIPEHLDQLFKNFGDHIQSKGVGRTAKEAK